MNSNLNARHHNYRVNIPFLWQRRELTTIDFVGKHRLSANNSVMTPLSNSLGQDKVQEEKLNEISKLIERIDRNRNSKK